MTEDAATPRAADTAAAMPLSDTDTATTTRTADTTTSAAEVAADWAASGAMWLTGMAGGPPLLPPGRAASAAGALLRRFEELSTLAGHPVRLDGRRLLGERAAAAGLSRNGPWSVGGTFRIVPTADGALGLTLARPSDIELVPALVGGPVDDPWRAVGAWAAGTPTSDAVDRARLLGLPACAVGSPAVFEPTWPPRGPDWSKSDRAPLVVDLSALWAGPLCAHLLGLAGARVVKVESVHRPDGGRRGPAAFYDLLHAGHESVALDFTSGRGQAQLTGLLEAADIVIEASRPRALAQLGIDAEDLVARGTSKTWVSITAYGRTGPAADWVGFGDDVAAAAGLVVTDPDSGTLLPCGDALADPLTGAHAAVLALSSFFAGGNRLIDVAMYHVVAATMTDPRGDGTVAEAQRTSIRAPAGTAPALGADTERVLRELGLGLA